MRGQQLDDVEAGRTGALRRLFAVRMRARSLGAFTIVAASAMFLVRFCGRTVTVGAADYAGWQRDLAQGQTVRFEFVKKKSGDTSTGKHQGSRRPVGMRPVVVSDRVVESMGRLNRKQEERARFLMNHMKRGVEWQLAKLRPEATLLEVARLYEDILLDDACMDLLAKGRYYTLAVGAAVPPKIAGHLRQTYGLGLVVDGKPVEVVLDVPLADYPALARAARDRRQALTLAVDDWVARFNETGDVERRKRFEVWRQARERTKEARAFAKRPAADRNATMKTIADWRLARSRYVFSRESHRFYPRPRTR